MNYGELIGDAFRITLRNRYLWFFGFFAGGSTSFNFPTNVPSGGGNFNPDDFRQSSTMLSPPRSGRGMAAGSLSPASSLSRLSSLCSSSSCR